MRHISTSHNNNMNKSYCTPPVMTIETGHLCYDYCLIASIKAEVIAKSDCKYY